MNKKERKLVLAKDTLRLLAGPELRQVAAAGPGQSTQCLTGNCLTAEVSCQITVQEETVAC